MYTKRFIRTNKYNPDWIINGGNGANALWLAEWLSESINFQPGMHVLDLGCGSGTSSIFLANEFNVKVWAVDLFYPPSKIYRRVQDAGLEKSVFPVKADARTLPFAFNYFDIVICIDTILHFATDDLFLYYISQYVKSNGVIGFAAAGLQNEIETIPNHLKDWWGPHFSALHSESWWYHHWNRSNLVDIQVSDKLADGWKYWLQWQKKAYPNNWREINAISADKGENLTYIRITGKPKKNTNDEENELLDGFPKYISLLHLK